jgi:hypothetical protein
LRRNFVWPKRYFSSPMNMTAPSAGTFHRRIYRRRFYFSAEFFINSRNSSIFDPILLGVFPSFSEPNHLDSIYQVYSLEPVFFIFLTKERKASNHKHSHFLTKCQKSDIPLIRTMHFLHLSIQFFSSTRSFISNFSVNCFGMVNAIT